jgi:hypothetical protein
MEIDEKPGIEMMSNSQGVSGSFGDSAEIIKQHNTILDENKKKKEEKEQEDEDEQIRQDEEGARKAGLVFFNVGRNKETNKKQKRALIGIENLVGDRTQIHTKIDTASTLSSAAAAASGLVTVLAASGIGMPVSALLAGALLVANKMLDLYKNNLLLRLLMQDAIFIIMDCYLLFSLIEKSYEIIGTYSDPPNECANKESSTKEAMTRKDFEKIYDQNKKTEEEKTDIANIQKATSSIRKYQINGIMQAQLKYQIEKLIKTLLSIMETKTLKIIEQDPALHNNAFGKLLLAEQKKRDAEKGLTGYYSKFDRNYNRKFGSSIYITEINNALTIINSYLVLLKSNLDTLLKKFEILTPKTYEAIWRAILCSKEYNEYIKPNTQDVIDMAKTDVRTVDPDKLITAIDFVDTVGQNAEAKASRGGSGRNYLRPRIKRKTERRLKKRQLTKSRGRRRQNKKSKRRT